MHSETVGTLHRKTGSSRLRASRSIPKLLAWKAANLLNGFGPVVVRRGRHYLHFDFPVMLPRLILRTLRSADKRCIWKFLWNFGFKGMRSVEKFKSRIKRGE